jgi:hypothetical protein
MERVTYEQALEDRDYLFEIGEADDYTGGYEPLEDLEKLLHNPTKKCATGCLVTQIQYWFAVGTQDLRREKTMKLIAQDAILMDIKRRYNLD